jgi:DNA-binding transcriptional MerR regulator
LRTSDIAAAAGVHPNTVRLYETWGFLPPAARGANGYRHFTEFHRDQMCLARAALHGDWPGPKIRQSVLNLVRVAATGNLAEALALAQIHTRLVAAECAQAEAAVDFLKQWAAGPMLDPAAKPLSIGQVAELLDVSVDMLRDWERNGLIQVARHPRSRYRGYGSLEIGRLRVIRLLRRAGYSTMAILRMLRQFDRGQAVDLRAALDTPEPEEDVYTAADRWLSALAGQRARAAELVARLR